MHISAIPLALSLLPLTLAQYGGGSSSDESSSSDSASTTVSGKIHKINVGEDNKLVFTPDTVTAAVGDYIEWHFFPPTHSVVQASFDEPCAPIDGAFFSGGFATTTGENANVFRVLVNSTEPLWFYCGFPGHCQTGMVGVINPPSNATVEQFAQAAATAPSVSAPRTASGGVVGAAATEASASATQSTASPSSTGNAGVESRGSVQWVMFGFTGVVAALFGSLIV